METTSLLKFNGQYLPFAIVDGTVYVALKPICDALGINFDRQYKNLKKDSVLSGAYAVQHMRDAENRMRKYVALPEFFVYGWLFSIRSAVGALQDYKLQCYKILWNYFHGGVAERKQALKHKAQIELEMDELRRQLKNENELYNRLNQLQGERLRIDNILKKIDEKETKKQLILFNQ